MVAGRNILMSMGAAVVLAWAVPLAVHAAEGGPLEDAFYLGLGVFAFSSDTELRLDGDAGRGTDIDWERDLGVPDDEDSFRIDAFWRFADRHKIRAMYFDSKRGSSKALNREITIQDEVYPIDAVLEVSLETRILEIAYEYAFLKRDNYEIAGTAGIHLTELVPEATITGSVGGADVDVGQSGKADVEMPLPVLGLRGMWHLGRNFYLDAHAQYFYLSIDDSDGSIADLRAALSWNPSWFGVGVGYNQFVTRLDVDRDSFDGEMDWTYRGPQFFFIATF